MEIEHTAILVHDLCGAKAFFEHYFNAKANAGYYNPKTGLRSFFLTFDGSARLEIMSNPGSMDSDKDPLRTGYHHLAFSVGSTANVDLLTRRLQEDGYQIVSGPRMTGDGYYESCVIGFEGNRIEITV